MGKNRFSVTQFCFMELMVFTSYENQKEEKLT